MQGLAQPDGAWCWLGPVSAREATLARINPRVVVDFAEPPLERTTAPLTCLRQAVTEQAPTTATNLLGPQASAWFLAQARSEAFVLVEEPARGCRWQRPCRRVPAAAVRPT